MHRRCMLIVLLNEIEIDTMQKELLEHMSVWCVCDLLVSEYVHSILDFQCGESEIGYVENRSLYNIHILYTHV